MRAILKAFSIAACGPLQAHARRLDHAMLAGLHHEGKSLVNSRADSKVNSGWADKEARFCIDQEVKLTCDADSIITVRTAFYNKAKKDFETGLTCEPSTAGKEASCGKRNTAMVKEKCDGRRSCAISPEEHSFCEASPFTFMRVTFQCEAGAPVNEEEKAETPPATKVLAPEPIKDSEALGPKTGDEGARLEEMMDDTKKVNLKDVKGAKGVQAYKGVKKPGEIQTTKISKCYRLNRFQKIWRLHAFSRLTNCGEFEGCFKVKFMKNGKEFWYDNESQAPNNKELMKGELVKHTDDPLVTWQGVGLQRNDYWSWGVCLPKTKGAEAAVETWDSLKALYAGEE